MEWGIAYCLVCWSVAWYWAKTSDVARDVQNEADCDAETAEGSVWLTVAFAPLIVPGIFVVAIPCLVRQLIHIWKCHVASRTHLDPDLTSVNMLTLPEQARNWFESQTPAFFQHGFRMLDDVCWCREPIRMDVRAFLAEEGDIFGSICASEETGDGEDGWLLLDMTSILQDGTMVETTSMSADKLDVHPKSSDGYLIAFAPENTVDSVLETHLEALEQSGQMVHCFAPEQFRDVKIYEKRVFSWWKHRSGKIKEAPPEAVLPVSVELADSAFRELVEA